MCPVRFWWVEAGDSPSELSAFPFHCHKFIVLRDDDAGQAHVVASDARLDQHADIDRALAAWRIRDQPATDVGPSGGLSGGGHGGERFPGLSQAFGPPPPDVIRSILGGDEEAAGEVPVWVSELLAQRACRSVETLRALAEADPMLSVQVDPLTGTVEIEHFTADWEDRTATVSIEALFPRG